MNEMKCAHNSQDETDTKNQINPLFGSLTLASTRSVLTAPLESYTNHPLFRTASVAATEFVRPTSRNETYLIR
jgi:hypothetical protein